MRYRMFVVFMFATGAALAQTAVEETRAAKLDGVVNIDNTCGSIEVLGWDKAEVHVTGTLEKNVERLDFETLDGRTQIRVVIPKRAHRAAEAYLTIQVPNRSRLEIEAVSASVHVSEVVSEMDIDAVSGDVKIVGHKLQPEMPANEVKAQFEEGKMVQLPKRLEVQTVSGGIHVEADAENIQLETVSGEITFAGHWTLTLDAEATSGDVQLSGQIGSLSANTISGDIKAEGVQSAASVSTSSGDVQVAGETLRVVDMETVSGDAGFKGALASDGSLDVSTSSGDVTLGFTKPVEGQFDLETTSGDLDVQLGTALPSAMKSDGGKSLEFTTGSGAAVVNVDTVSGGIIIR